VGVVKQFGLHRVHAFIHAGIPPTHPSQLMETDLHRIIYSRQVRGTSWRGTDCTRFAVQCSEDLDLGAFVRCRS